MQTIRYRTAQYYTVRFGAKPYGAPQSYTLNAYCKRSFLTQELSRRPLDSRGGIVWNGDLQVGSFLISYRRVSTAVARGRHPQ